LQASESKSQEHKYLNMDFTIETKLVFWILLRQD